MAGLTGAVSWVGQGLSGVGNYVQQKFSGWAQTPNAEADSFQAGQMNDFNQFQSVNAAMAQMRADLGRVDRLGSGNHGGSQTNTVRSREPQEFQPVNVTLARLRADMARVDQLK